MLRRASKRKHELQEKSRKTNKASIKAELSHLNALADNECKDSLEKGLEDAVLGGETDLVEKISQPKKIKTKRSKKNTRTKPVWSDDEDADVENVVDKVSGNPQWAKLAWEKSDDSESDNEGNSLLRSTGDHLVRPQNLSKNVIEYKTCSDANKEKPCTGKLKVVEFHPSAQVMLAAGHDHTLNLFQIDGKNNPKIQSVFLENYPVYSAHFSCDGREVIAASKHRGFVYYDMMAGKVVKVPKIKGMEENNMKRFIMSPDGRFIIFLGDYGYIHLLSSRTKEWIDTFKMNGSVECAALSSDGNKMFSLGSDGEVYVWDINKRAAIHRFLDEGCVQGTSIHVSPDNYHIATGSYSGVVNLYDDSCLFKENPVPLKAVMNLTSPCTSLKFNNTGEMLAMASNYTEHAIKLLHVSSKTVYTNFPNRTDNFRIPYCLDFSPNSGYLSVGSQQGRAALVRLKHYSSY